MDIKEVITTYELLCSQGRAQCEEAKEAKSEIRSYFARNGLEFCSHNWAILGSKRYASEKNQTINRLVSITEYQSAKKKWFRNGNVEPFDFQSVDMSHRPLVVGFSFAV